MCMTSRHTLRNAQGELVTLTNQELARLERTNRQQPRQTGTTMGDHANQDDLTTAMALMQQQIIEQATTGHNQNQNQQQPQSNRQAVPATGNSQPDELKGLGMMMQQLLQGQQVQAKALNQVTIEIDTRMGNMFTELSAKYDTVASHIRKIDVQLAQTAESVKRQQGVLPGKTEKNSRTEHCNAIEQLFAKTVLGAEENIEQSASSGVTAPSEPAETPPVRVYVPKVPYPIPPKHLMDPISAEQLAGFRKMVRRLPQKISFEHAWEIRPLHMFFKHCRETREEIKALFTEALTPSLKVLPKVDDPRKFVFPCSIAGVEFKEALCDSGSSVNLVSKAIVDELGIVDLILLRSFMATVGAIVDIPNKRVSFSNINKKVFYKAVPTRSQIRYASCISMVSAEHLKIVPKKEFSDKSEIKEFMDGDPHTDIKKLSGNAKLSYSVTLAVTKDNMWT
ncbi:hypothetical protein DY000_02016183 [Brassica cretica]|uniref:Aspartic peptidase DDI1-type domain-containing protein n=1 Tax=Brassica cretica TaxID=69181 RepID=A0ABQ7DCG2_BRACR|nr:hypothetical protein DY000_02016183 [Brassica cretica]